MAESPARAPAAGVRGETDRLTSQILFVVAGAVLLVTLVRLLARWREPQCLVAAVIVAIYAAWLFAEAPVTFRRRVPPAVERWTLVVYVAVRVATVAAAVLAPLPWRAWSYWMVPPLLVLVGGIGLRLAAIRCLGRFYTHRVAVQPDQTVVCSGPYRFVRHPAYAGMLAGNLGLVAFFHSPIALVAFAGLVVVLVWRISTEERALRRLPGYSDYARGRARLLPRVW